MSKRLSALVVAHDEAAQLADCLDCLRFADEIVVVLDRCTDASPEIARRFTAHVIEGGWPIEGERRNTGIDACTGDWILEVDADERIPPALAAEVRTVVDGSAADWHRIPVDNYVGRKLVRWGWGASFGRGSVASLFRKGAKRWGLQRVHPKLTFSGSEGAALNNRLDHYVDRNISDMIRRLDRYTTANASDLREKGNIGTLGHNLRRMFSRFWKCFVARKGYREGAWGVLIALMAALYPILSYLKARLEDDI